MLSIFLAIQKLISFYFSFLELKLAVGPMVPWFDSSFTSNIFDILEYLVMIVKVIYLNNAVNLITNKFTNNSYENFSIIIVSFYHNSSFPYSGSHFAIILNYFAEQNLSYKMSSFNESSAIHFVKNGPVEFNKYPFHVSKPNLLEKGKQELY